MISELEKWLEEKTKIAGAELVSIRNCDYLVWNPRLGKEVIYCARQNEIVERYCRRGE